MHQDFQRAMRSEISRKERAVSTVHPLGKLATWSMRYWQRWVPSSMACVPHVAAHQYPLKKSWSSTAEILLPVRSERQLVEAIDYNLPHRWFMGFSIGNMAWDHSTFSVNGKRLFEERLSCTFFKHIERTPR